jgi:hypothetical protein
VRGGPILAAACTASAATASAAAIDAVAATATAVIVKQDEQMELLLSLTGVCVVTLS